MRRYEHNPIITRTDIPHCPPDLVDVSSVFNPGAVRYEIMVKPAGSVVLDPSSTSDVSTPLEAEPQQLLKP